MAGAISAMAGAALTLAVSVSLGIVLLRALSVEFRKTEFGLFAFIAGSACLSLLVFGLAVIHQVRSPVLAVLGVGTAAAAVWYRPGRGPRLELPSVGLSWLALLNLIFAAYFLIYLVIALAPEVSADGSGYHLGNVVRMTAAHGFDWTYHSMYSYLSQGMEMLFLVAYQFGNFSSSALIHFAFQATLPLLMVCYGRRFGVAKPAIFAAAITYACPVVGLSGSAAYNDLAVATLSFAVFYLLQVWDQHHSVQLLILSGLLAGTCYGIKYTAGVAIPFAVSFVLVRGYVGGRLGLALRNALAVLLPGLAVAAVWAIRNWLWLGNPFAPFLNSVFPNPYYHPGMEQAYLNSLRGYPGLVHWWQIPLNLTLGGGHTAGLLGPAYLLAPLALIGLRDRHSRRLLAAAAVFAIPGFFNSSSRFLIPSLAFASLGLGVALQPIPGALPAIALLHAILCWPVNLRRYCDPDAPRIWNVPVKAALGRQPEAEFIAWRLPETGIAPAIERIVPAGGRIFSFTTLPEAYLPRPIVVSYESALGNFANDALLAPISSGGPSHLLQLQFAATEARGVRIVQDAKGDGYWSIAEIHMRMAGREVSRAQGWRISATPNPWEAGLAFDGNPATRWSTWQSMAPGHRLQVEFGAAEPIDEIKIDYSRAWEARAHVEILNAANQWRRVEATQDFREVGMPSDLRRQATRALRAHGLDFLLVRDSDAAANDIRGDPTRWGLIEVGASHGIRLYRIN